MLSKSCRKCAATILVKPSHFDKVFYCSRACYTADRSVRFSGPNSPLWKGGRPERTCIVCGGKYRSSRKNRRTCSMACRLPPSARLSEQHKAKIAAAHRGRPKGPNHTIPGKKDRNHDEIAAGLRAAGYPIIETNKVGGGAPDIIANRGDTLIFIEIKNPATKYGRKGLRPSQARFKAEWEAFCPYVVVFTLEDAIQAMRG